MARARLSLWDGTTGGLEEEIDRYGNHDYALEVRVGKGLNPKEWLPGYGSRRRKFAKNTSATSWLDELEDSDLEAELEYDKDKGLFKDYNGRNTFKIFVDLDENVDDNYIWKVRDDLEEKVQGALDKYDFNGRFP